MVKIHYFLIVLLLVFSFSLNYSPLAFSQEQTDAEKIYKKIEERIKKTKNRLQYIDRYGSWNDNDTTKYFGLTKLAFNKMLSIGEICYTSQVPEKLQECDTQTKKLYDAAKSGYRLTKYFAILSGKQNTCVMANLGVKPNRDGTPVEPDRTKFGTRPQSLYLCSGPENSPINPDLRWRVEAKDGGMIKIKEEYRSDPKFMQNIDNQRNAEKLVQEVLGGTQ